MSPPAKKDWTPFSDIPPGVAKIIHGMQTNLKVLYGLFGTALAGLVFLAQHCLNQGG